MPTKAPQTSISHVSACLARGAGVQHSRTTIAPGPYSRTSVCICWDGEVRDTNPCIAQSCGRGKHRAARRRVPCMRWMPSHLTGCGLAPRAYCLKVECHGSHHNNGVCVVMWIAILREWSGKARPFQGWPNPTNQPGPATHMSEAGRKFQL
ncbi:hypothetical protein BS50DRAFT_275126 [Corynespora cassiicola Philippines]|uniref:Uncharacterized protein n=1 Tax=Corynespora cassiicola Philippines TaxID=1448308 RepID=A0A2T2P0G6_CORCC|nr:hypothetical protein BS50DRAFT_275126 [Corynespora cassiicola Philippines]